jgi:hypothetical protein
MSGVAPRNGAGTAALVLGIVGLLICGPLGILAVILGFVGIGRADSGYANNKGAAVAGVVLGFATLGLWAVFMLVYLSSATY